MKHFEIRISNLGLWCGVAAIFLIVFTTSASGQLADAARKERERRKQIESKIVFTNERVPGAAAAVQARTGSVSPSTAAAGKEGSGKPAGPVDNKGRDETFWRAAFQTARDAVKRADERLQLVGLQMNELNMQLLRQSDIYNRENRIGAAKTAKLAEIEAARKDLDDARKKLTDLDQELRRSGGVPGWAR